MRALAVALWVAWASIGIQLSFLPPEELGLTLKLTENFLKELKNGNPASLEVPYVQEEIARSERILADPTTQEIAIWLRWIGLLFIVGLGLVAGYTVFRRRPYAVQLVLISSVLFLLRQGIFYDAEYKNLLHGFSIIPFLFKEGQYRMAFSSLWFNYILGIFFVSLTAFGAMNLMRTRGRHSTTT